MMRRLHRPTSAAGRLLAAALLLVVILPVRAGAQDATIKGEVRTIDEAAGKITLRHGPIKALGMDDPSMTMVFHVKDPAMLKQVKVGDRVLFEAGDLSEGLTITKLQKAK
ncbi:MAG: copper-binding protein [Xanthobacteraceae bacterium]|nr:copper-binding protein [Xanthobacteraceae bacterium]